VRSRFLDDLLNSREKIERLRSNYKGHDEKTDRWQRGRTDDACSDPSPASLRRTSLFSDKARERLTREQRQRRKHGQMIMSQKSPSNKDRKIGEAEPQNKQDRLGGDRLPPPKRPQRFNHLPDAEIPQQTREKNHSEMDCDETFQNKTKSCFRLDVANRKRPGPQIRVMQVSLQLVVPGQCGNDRDESNYDTATCCQNTCERVGAGNEPAINETRQQYAQFHGRSLPDQGCYPDQYAAEKH